MHRLQHRKRTRTRPQTNRHPRKSMPPMPKKTPAPTPSTSRATRKITRFAKKPNKPSQQTKFFPIKKQPSLSKTLRLVSKLDDDDAIAQVNFIKHTHSPPPQAQHDRRRPQGPVTFFFHTVSSTVLHQHAQTSRQTTLKRTTNHAETHHKTHSSSAHLANRNPNSPQNINRKLQLSD